MLTRLFIWFIKLLLFLITPMHIHANEFSYSSNSFSNFSIENIDQFFLQNPQKKNIIISPKIDGKSKYAFSIPKDAYLISKKYADASDLYYLSEKIDNELTFHQNSSVNLDVIISENNSNLTLSQNILFNINSGLFLQNKEKKSFGLNFNKDFILSKNTLGNFGVEQVSNDYTVFNAKFVKLSTNENSEFYGNINHKYNSNQINVGIGNTWFEILNQFDFTVGVQEQDKKVESEMYVSFDDENIKFQIGLDQIKNISEMNIFFNLKFEKNLEMKKFKTNFMITSRDSIFGLRNLSLKSYTRKSLDILWKKYINFN